jgi:hypothetical protein
MRFFAISKVFSIRLCCAVALAGSLLAALPYDACAQRGGGRGGGGSMGGSRGGSMGGGSMGGSRGGSGGSFRSSGGMNRGSMPSSSARGGGSVRMAPSRAPSAGRAPVASRSAPSVRQGGTGGATAGNSVRSPSNLPGATANRGASAVNKAGTSIGRAPQATRSGAGGGAAKGAGGKGAAARNSASWKASSQEKLQTVNTKLNGAVNKSKPPAANHSVSTPAASGRNSSGMQSKPSNPKLANRANTIRSNYQKGNHQCLNNNNWWIGRSVIGWGYGFGGGGFGGVGYGWGYQPWLGYRPWSYWWGVPTWNSCVSWFPSYGWDQGCYYDYGPSGNVIYQDGQVVVNGEEVGTAEEYADSAAYLAEIDPAAIQAIAPDDWMALGTFSMAVTENEVDPARVIQLAVSKDGIISGTIHNRQSGNTYSVQGRVDKDTQRVAFTIGDDRNTVMETGIFNLTQDQTPVLCHFSGSQTQTYMLARLPAEIESPAPNPPPDAPSNDQ